MNFNDKEFDIILLKKDKTKEDVAKCIGISLPTLYRKINGISDFYRNEIQKICEYLDLSIEEKENIFFN